MKKYFILWSVFVLLLSGCNSGKKMLQKGDYYGAVMKSVEKLRSSPGNDKARETLAEAYPLAVATLLDKIENEKAAQSDFQNTEAVHVYEALNRMYESILQSPAAMEVIRKPKKYYAQLGKAKNKAAEEQYLAGMAQLAMQTRTTAKEAYYYFKEAHALVPNYKDVVAKIDESHELATLRVLASLVPVQSRRYKLSAGVFYQEVEKVLREIERNDFILFYTPEQAKKNKISNPDQYLVIGFEDFVVGKTHTSERVEQHKKDSVKLSTITLEDGSKRDVLGTVRAELTINRMEVLSNGAVNLMITHGGFDKRVLLKEDIEGHYVWFNEWGHFNGDERALNEKQLDICDARQVMPPSPQQLFVEFTKPIHAQVRSKLIRFYEGY